MKILFSFFICFMLISEIHAQEVNLRITSPAFKNNEQIPSKYTCNDSNTHPPLLIKNVPRAAKSLVLFVYDINSPEGDFAHWVVYNIPPKIKIISKNLIPGNELINDFNQFSYKAPCPNDGKTHHYIFDLYALNTTFAINVNGSARGFLQRIQGHILDKAQLRGLYKNDS